MGKIEQTFPLLGDPNARRGQIGRPTLYLVKQLCQGIDPVNLILKIGFLGDQLPKLDGEAGIFARVDVVDHERSQRLGGHAQRRDL